MGTVTSLVVTVPTDTVARCHKKEDCKILSRRRLFYSTKEKLNMKRRPLSKKAAKKTFRKGARTAGMNIRRKPSRGGIRL